MFICVFKVTERVGDGLRPNFQGRQTRGPIFKKRLDSEHIHAQEKGLGRFPSIYHPFTLSPLEFGTMVGLAEQNGNVSTVKRSHSSKMGLVPVRLPLWECSAPQRHSLLPDRRVNDITSGLRNAKPFYSFTARTNRFHKSFLPYCLDSYTQAQGADLRQKASSATLPERHPLPSLLLPPLPSPPSPFPSPPLP